MRRLRELTQYRDTAWERRLTGGHTAASVGKRDVYGCFKLEGPRGVELRVIAAADEGWDHVSVTAALPRCPDWSEMEFVKRTFFAPDETAMQLHVATHNHISHHDFCLHLWRPHAQPIPLPPASFV
jgi:hypothetical protein